MSPEHSVSALELLPCEPCSLAAIPDYSDKRLETWPRVVKTVAVVQVERTFCLSGECLGDFLFCQYWVEGNSTRGIAVRVGVAHRWVLNYMDKYGIARRSKSAAAVLSWEGENKLRRVARTHSPGAKNRRSVSIKAYWGRNPDQAKRVAVNAREAQRRKRFGLG